MKQVDIIIVGAGVVGLTLANLLIDILGCRVAIVDAKTLPEQMPEQQGPRVSAVNAFTSQVFKHLGIWEQALVRAGNFRDMCVWDQLGRAIEFNAGDIHEVHLGHIVENEVLRYLLQERLQPHALVTWLIPEKAQSISELDAGVALQLASGESVIAQLLIAADGANSWVREHQGFEIIDWDYGHSAIVSHVQTSKGHANTAWQRFLTTGPLAFLPLQDKRTSSIVWSSSPEQVESLLAMTDEQFCEHLGEAFEHQLGEVVSCSSRFSFPLRMRHSKQYLQGPVVLVGDAAHTIHPLAGQGLNIGIQDCVCLVKNLKAAQKSAKSLCNKKYLRAYERERRAENWQVILMMEFLKRIYGDDRAFIQQLLGFGLQVTKNVLPLKSLLLNAAKGPVEEVSSLFA